MLTKWLSRYPDGVAGIGLVLLRFSCAWVALLAIAPLQLLRLSPDASTVLAAALAFATLLGLWTRTAAFLSVAAALAGAFVSGTDTVEAMLARACSCAALGLLGPGAYSIDANIFGRRVIRLEPRGPDRTTDA